jgi:hypothetical protein
MMAMECGGLDRAEAPMTGGLPAPNTRRWVARRKAAVIIAIRGAVITLEEALERYHLTNEEYQSWERAFDAYGLLGLRATPKRSKRDAAHRSPR